MRYIVMLAIFAFDFHAPLAAEREERFVYPIVSLSATVPSNVSPNDPALPREVAFRVVVNFEGGLLEPITAWTVDFGDGTVSEFADEEVRTSTSERTFTHVYTTAGVMHITAEPDVWRPVSTSGPGIATARTLVGKAPITIQPRLSVTPTFGTAPLVVTFRVQSWPSFDASPYPQEPTLGLIEIDPPTGFGLGDAGRPFPMDPVAFEQSITLPVEGAYKFTWVRDETRVPLRSYLGPFWGENEVWLIADESVQVEVARGSSGLARLGEPQSIENINTPGDEWNARVAAGEQRLYYLSDWPDGVVRLMRATRNGQGVFESPEALSGHGTSLGGDGHIGLFEIAPDESVLVLARMIGPGLDFSSFSEPRLTISERVADKDGVPQFGQPTIIQPTSGIARIHAVSASALRLYGHRHGEGYETWVPSSTTIPWLYGRVEQGDVRSDQLPRLISADGSVRFWTMQLSGQQRFFGATDGPAPTVSLLESLSAPELIDRYEIAELDADDLEVECLTPGGERLYFTLRSQVGDRFRDIYVSEVFTRSPTRRIEQRLVVEHLKGDPVPRSIEELDHNADDRVDASDIESIAVD